MVLRSEFPSKANKTDHEHPVRSKMPPKPFTSLSVSARARASKSFHNSHRIPTKEKANARGKKGLRKSHDWNRTASYTVAM